MTEMIDEGLEALPAQAAEAAAAMAGLRGPAEEAARAISSSFERAGASLVRSLARAASDGKISLDEVAEAALQVFELLVRSGERGRGGGGLAEAIASAAAGFAGARAEGGPVLAGGHYLVGERGPEVFRPTSGGQIEPLGGGAMTINVTLVPGADSGLARSEGQIAQALARAVLLGARRLG